MASPNIFQQVFGLNLASNLVGTCAGTTWDLQKKFKDALPAALAQVGPGWEVAWGPVIWKFDEFNPWSRQGNAWYIAKNSSVTFEDGTSHCTYVIAIAGTSGYYDLIFEDFSIGTVVNLDTWAKPGYASINSKPVAVSQKDVSPGEAYVSNGFGQAVYELLNNISPKNCPGAGTTLPQFLQSLSSSDPSSPTAKLIITGHSLGGALSPSLAYTLLKAQALGPFVQSNVLIYPTAGPSPGDQQFADNFEAAFPSKQGLLTGYQFWNVNIVNTLDIIPCAYCTQDKFKPLYFPDTLTKLGTPSPIYTAIIDGLMKAAGAFYVPIKASLFTSKFPYPPPSPMKWLHRVHQQHVPAYTWQVLGIEPPKGVCATNVEKDLSMRPLVGTMIRLKWQIEASKDLLTTTNGEEGANALLKALLDE